MCIGHPPSGDLFALGSKSSRQSNSPSPALPPAKKPHLEELDEGTSSGGNVLFSDPIKIAQSKVGVVSESTSKLAIASLPGPQPIEGKHGSETISVWAWGYESIIDYISMRYQSSH